MSSDITTLAPTHPAGLRRHDLDALRIVLVLGLIVFHSALVFDTNDDFYVKNDVTMDVTGVLAGPIIVWAMPALFLVAGIAARQSLRRRSPGTFVRERLVRLGIPLLAITLLVTPIPQWLRALRAEPTLSYFEFLPRFFAVRLDASQAPFFLVGDWFEFGHLWFVVLLLAWSLVLALVVAMPPRGRLARVAGAAERWLATAPANLLLPGIAFAVVGAVLPLEEGFAAWNRWSYLLFFAAGALLGSDAMRAPIRRAVPLLAAVAIVCFGIGIAVFLTSGGQDLFTDASGPAVAFRVCYGVTGWCATLAIIGALDRLAVRTAAPPLGRAQHYLGVVSLPLYIVHQPIVVIIAFVVVAFEWPPLAKFALIVALSYVISFGIVEVMRRTPGIRRAVGVVPPRTP